MTSPDELSPAPVPSPPPTALPFDLTWTDLEDALPEGAVGDSAVVSHVKRGQHQGGRPSMTLTLSYDAPSGHRGQTTLFFKVNPEDSREAERYRFLAGHGIPVPHLALCLRRDHEEVLGLEFLPSIGVGPADVDEVLRLVAALNSLTDLPDAMTRTPPGLPQAQFERLLARVLHRLGPHPDQGTTTWFDTYRRALVLHQRLPTTLTHGELAPQQLGRTPDGVLVMFDLATVGRRPRFADIANLLATLARLAARDERSIMGDYLTYLTRRSGAAVLDEQDWAELRLTRFVQGIEALPWHLSLQQPAQLHQQLQTIAGDHRAVLARLSG